MSGCIFCGIIAQRLSASFVAEDESTVAFMSLRQPVPGHVLVVPRRHAPTIYDLTPDEGSAVMNLALRVAHGLRRAYSPAGLNLWQCNGEIAGQEIDHFHLHLQPRQIGDGMWNVYPNGVPDDCPRAYLDELAAQLLPHL
ncbi:MAG: HIT domain-containing protein [Proteobacteria bacterium]|uniref:HIT family protein n=1 Tax=Rudaea sp. TaxID=2136325 RepID=UPI00378350B0|nr:HIT domain-containing protein [Pseudomonadota bacterium]